MIVCFLFMVCLGTTPSTCDYLCVGSMSELGWLCCNDVDHVYCLCYLFLYVMVIHSYFISLELADDLLVHF